ncbi:MAG: ABC transporter substrate-binding protein [Pseudomonadota bacterium]
MTALNLMVYRHSAFYSPILSAIAGGFLAHEGFEATYTVMPPQRSVGEMIASGEIHVSQTAVSGSWAYLEKGEKPPFLHFGQINQRDGFLIASRRPDANFRWEKLATGRFMFVHGGQPQAMLAYALHKKGVNIAALKGLDAGNTGQMMAAFRAGQGDYFHEQAPYPQQLEHEGVAHAVASVGEAIGPVAFSSLAASPAWLAGPDAQRFMRAYRKAREWVNTAPPGKVATAEQSFFPDIHREALARSIAYYQELGCWAGEVTIDRAHYETALDVFAHSKLITKRHAYDEVVAPPPV